MLRHIILPQLTPALGAAAIFAFSWSFNNFEIDFFVGGYDQTFPVWVYSELRRAPNLPIINASSTLISFVQVLMVVVAWRLLRGQRRRGRLVGGRMRCHDGRRPGPPSRDGSGCSAG